MLTDDKMTSKEGVDKRRGRRRKEQKNQKRGKNDPEYSSSTFFFYSLLFSLFVCYFLLCNNYLSRRIVPPRLSVATCRFRHRFAPICHCGGSPTAEKRQKNPYRLALAVYFTAVRSNFGVYSSGFFKSFPAGFSTAFSGGRPPKLAHSITTSSFPPERPSPEEGPTYSSIGFSMFGQL